MASSIAEVEQKLKDITPTLASLDAAIRSGDKDKLRDALVKATEFYIARFSDSYSEYSQAPAGSRERYLYDQMEELKQKQSTISQQEIPSGELQPLADNMLNALKESKRVLESMKRNLQQFAGRRRRNTRRRGRGPRKTQRRKAKRPSRG